MGKGEIGLATGMELVKWTHKQIVLEECIDLRINYLAAFKEFCEIAGVRAGYSRDLGAQESGTAGF
jgi:hypothetical protein